MATTLLVIVLAVILVSPWFALRWLHTEIGALRGIDRQLARRFYGIITLFFLSALVIYVAVGATFATYYWVLDHGAPKKHFECAPCSWSDLAYFSIVTLATVGYGDIVPKSTEARLAVSLEILVGFVLIVFMISLLVGLAPLYATESAARIQGLVNRLEKLRSNIRGRT